MKQKIKTSIVDDDAHVVILKEGAEAMPEVKERKTVVPDVSEPEIFKEQSRSFFLDDRFAVQAVTGVIMVKYDSVLLFEFPKHKRNWELFFVNEKRLTLRATINSKEILSITPSFVQINQNCIINIKYLASIENRTYRCKFYPPFDKIEVIITPKYYKLIKEMMAVL